MSAATITAGAAAALASLAFDPAASAAAPIRYALDWTLPAQEPPGVDAASAHFRSRLAAEGWVETAAPDVVVHVAWTARHGAVCGRLEAGWRLASGDASPLERCVAGHVDAIGLRVPPSGQEVEARVARPLVDHLLGEASARWLLRLVRSPAGATPSVAVGAADATGRVRWDGDMGVLSLPPGARATVRDGPCAIEASEAAPEVDLGALAGVQRFRPRWTVAGRAVDHVVATQGELVSVGLRLEKVAGSGGVQVRCGGDVAAALAGAGAETTATSAARDAWTWDVRTTAADGTLVASLRAAHAAVDATVDVPLRFRPPWWRILWVQLTAGLAAVATVVKLLVPIVKGARELGQRGPADASGRSEAPPAGDAQP